MNKDDRRYRAAYHLLRGHIAAQIALGHLTGGARAEAERVLASVESELNPPEFEEVEVVRWVCLVCGESYFHDTSLCRCHATGVPTERYVPVKLTGTVKRPVKRPVVKSCPMTLTGDGWIGDGLDIAGEYTFPLKGTFTWQK